MSNARERESRDGRGGRPGGRYHGGPRRGYHRRKVCRFCTNPEIKIDYKDAKALRPYITERGKITPRRVSGNCAAHQRKVSQAIKRARNIAILPFTTTSI
ncbi:MAG TPA: 30S ribosomal protein S18 [Deltaproteobacteria bacterium]|nr:30S ribosomal protein S18 [Deltaproteobacteria bacterium]